MDAEYTVMKPEGEIIEDMIVAACHPWSGHVAKGNVLRLIDLEG